MQLSCDNGDGGRFPGTLNAHVYTNEPTETLDARVVKSSQSLAP